MERQFSLCMYFLLLLCLTTAVRPMELRPNCGFPGKPYRAKMAPEEKLVYSDGEVVSYQCVDYWASPQERKCINGTWTGKIARCGDFVSGVLMKDVKTLDMSAIPRPRLMWHHTDMNITNTDWKYPNAFTSNRFKKDRLRINDDHEYRWYFNFTKPVTKLYVKMNFNFMNFTLLSEEVKKAHRFDIEVEISPHRTCVLDYQHNNLWRDSGNRIDTYFICEAHSYEDLLADAADPPNYMVMRTKSSHNISHEFVALFFGRVYGNDSEPLCGEPETDYGQSFRANQEFRDYMIDCATKDDWVNVKKDRFSHFSNTMKCIGDMIWNGTYPMCVPVKTCSLDGVFKRMMAKNNNKTITDQEISLAGANAGKTDPKNAPIHSSHPKLIIDSITNYYHFIENDTIYATPGTELTYNCLEQDSYILAGKDLRKCRSDGTWSGNEPTCRFLESNNKLIESSNSLMVAIIIMGILLVIIIAVSCILFVLYTRRLRKKKAELEAEKAEVNAWQNDMNLYDNIELGGSGKRAGEDGIYEVYEHIDDQYIAAATAGNEYTPYNDPSYSYAAMNDPHYGNLTGIDDVGDNSDYVRMLRESRTYQHLLPPGASIKSQGGRVVIMRKDSRKNRDPEPSYLEISK